MPDTFKIGTVGPALPGVSTCGSPTTARSRSRASTSSRSTGRTRRRRPRRSRTAGSAPATSAPSTTTASSPSPGRKKEIIVTAGGKNVSPAALEDPIRANPLVSQVIVVGDQKPFIAALVTLDTEMLPTWLANNGEDKDMTLAEASVNPAVHAEIQRAIDVANAGVSRAESHPQVRRARHGPQRGERTPDAEAEHQAQRHPRRLRRRDRRHLQRQPRARRASRWPTEPRSSIRAELSLWPRRTAHIRHESSRRAERRRRGSSEEVGGGDSHDPPPARLRTARGARCRGAIGVDPPGARRPRTRRRPVVAGMAQIGVQRQAAVSDTATGSFTSNRSESVLLARASRSSDSGRRVGTEADARERPRARLAAPFVRAGVL